MSQSELAPGPGVASTAEPAGPAEPSRRADSQISGLAGELFVAAELLKRGLQASVTFGNAKAIDLFACHPETDRTFSIEVKTLRKKNYFLLSHTAVKPERIYVFVLLNGIDEAVEYFIVPGKRLRSEPERFGKYFQIEKMPGIQPNDLAEFKGNWLLFQERTS
jgi:hypothetical protein